MRYTTAMALTLALGAVTSAQTNPDAKGGPSETTVHATGTLMPTVLIDVGAQVNGAIQQLGHDPHDAAKTIDWGSRVEEGTPLAQIDPKIYQARVELARAGLKRSEAELLLASTQYQHAERDWTQLKQRGDKAASLEQMNAGQASYETAKANVEVNKARVLQSQANLKLAEINLGYCTIRSPSRGVIIDRRVNVGQSVNGSLNAPSLFLIAKDLKKLELWAQVGEADISRVKKGQAVRFTTASLPGTVFRGEVSQVRLNATLNQEKVTYTVVIATNNAEEKLLPYLTTDVEIVAAR